MARQDLGARLEQALRAWQGVEKRRMFGCDAYLIGGRLFGFLGGMGLVLKPPPSERDALLANPNVQPFLVRPGTPFGDWLQWPLSSAADLDAALGPLRSAYEHAKASPRKRRRR